MAVYTKINQKEINIINKNFNIDKVISFKGIKQGIENTNYLLKSKKKKYILTIFEKRVLQKEIPFFMKLMDNLNNSKINCPKPLKTTNNKIFRSVERYPSKDALTNLLNDLYNASLSNNVIKIRDILKENVEGFQEVKYE